METYLILPPVAFDSELRQKIIDSWKTLSPTPLIGPVLLKLIVLGGGGCFKVDSLTTKEKPYIISKNALES